MTDYGVCGKCAHVGEFTFMESGAVESCPTCKTEPSRISLYGEMSSTVLMGR
jgi:hypothetical protein